MRDHEADRRAERALRAVRDDANASARVTARLANRRGAQRPIDGLDWLAGAGLTAAGIIGGYFAATFRAPGPVADLDALLQHGEGAFIALIGFV